jgi:hypothetical protein
MLKIILLFSTFSILLCDLYVLNIEQGGDKASEYIDPMLFYEWSRPVGKIDFKESKINTNDMIDTLFSTALNNSQPDAVPFLYTYRYNGPIEPFSYEVKKSDSCLSFNYLDQSAQKNPNANCVLTIPDKEFEILENEDDQYRADKIIQFFSFNIFLKAGKLYLTRHDGNVFTQ